MIHDNKCHGCATVMHSAYIIAHQFTNLCNKCETQQRTAQKLLCTHATVFRTVTCKNVFCEKIDVGYVIGVGFAEGSIERVTGKEKCQHCFSRNIFTSNPHDANGDPVYGRRQFTN